MANPDKGILDKILINPEKYTDAINILSAYATKATYDKNKLMEALRKASVESRSLMIEASYNMSRAILMVGICEAVEGFAMAGGAAYAGYKASSKTKELNEKVEANEAKLPTYRKKLESEIKHLKEKIRNQNATDGQKRLTQQRLDHEKTILEDLELDQRPACKKRIEELEIKIKDHDATPKQKAATQKKLEEKLLEKEKLNSPLSREDQASLKRENARYQKDMEAANNQATMEMNIYLHASQGLTAMQRSLGNALQRQGEAIKEVMTQINQLLESTYENTNRLVKDTNDAAVRPYAMIIALASANIA